MPKFAQPQFQDFFERSDSLTLRRTSRSLVVSVEPSYIYNANGWAVSYSRLDAIALIASSGGVNRHSRSLNAIVITSL
jgi:hypothetical protein